MVISDQGGGGEDEMESPTNGSNHADPEVLERAAWRRVPPQYKLKILRGAEKC